MWLFDGYGCWLKKQRCCKEKHHLGSSFPSPSPSHHHRLVYNWLFIAPIHIDISTTDPTVKLESCININHLSSLVFKVRINRIQNPLNWSEKKHTHQTLRSSAIPPFTCNLIKESPKIYADDQEVHQPTAGASWKTQVTPGFTILGATHPSIVPCTVFQESYNTRCALSTLYCCCSFAWYCCVENVLKMKSAYWRLRFHQTLSCPDDMPMFLCPKDPQQMFPCFFVI